MSTEQKQKNLGVVFKQVPDGFPKPGQDLVVEDVGYDPSAELPDDSISVQTLYLSLDPYMRGRLRSSDVKSYFPAFEMGKPVQNFAVAKVLKSTSKDYQEGDLVRGVLSFQQYLTVPAKTRGLQKLPKDGPEDLRMWLGPLGLPGITAYASLYELGKPKKGETIFVSSAAGAVGQMVVQICKHEGLKVIGSVGSDEKLKYITEELGYDSGFNYKKESPGDALARLAPDGIDIYYENVGGEHLDAALVSLNNFGRIVACGMISQYNKKPGEGYGVKNLMLVVGKRLTMSGFIAGDDNMWPKWGQEHQERVSGWIKEGNFVAKMHEWDGIENGPDALLGMLQGENFGKAVLKV